METNNEIRRDEKYSDNKYKVFNISKDGKELRRINCESEGVCILPFDTNDKGSPKNYYLLKYQDYLSNKFGHICLHEDINPDTDSSYFDTLSRCISSQLGIDSKEIDINSVFYLGTIEHTLPFSKSYRCYALDLSKYSKDPSGFSTEMSGDNGKLFSVEKIKANRLLNGDIRDSLSLSCVALLLSTLR